MTYKRHTRLYQLFTNTSTCNFLESPIDVNSNPKPVITSPLNPIPLIVISRGHPYCVYCWECIDKPDMEFESTPVIHVDKPFVFK